MSCQEKLQVLAQERAVAYPLQESDVSIGGFRFWTNEGPIIIRATPENRAERFFFQVEAEDEPRYGDSIPGSLNMDQSRLRRAQAFFAEMWESETGTYPVLDAIRVATKVDLYWKD